MKIKKIKRMSSLIKNQSDFLVTKKKSRCRKDEFFRSH